MILGAWIPWLRFDTPGYLVLLALLPLIIVFSFRSLAGLGPIRRWLAIGARIAVLTLIILALAGAEGVRRSDGTAVMLLVDRSFSIPRPQQEAEFDFAKGTLKSLRATKDRLGIIAFDGRAAVEQLPMATVGVTRISDAPAPQETNLAAALRMAMALFPEDKARRVVVVSDGNENVGQALIEADQYAAAGVPIDVVPINYSHDNEVVFERLSAPPTANAEETINLQMVMRAQKATKGRVLLYHNEQLVDLDPKSPSAGFPIELNPGPNRVELPVPLRAAGAHRFRAVFEPDDAKADTILANNEGRAFTVVSGQGRILILTQGGAEKKSDWDSAQILSRALQSEKIESDVELAGESPLDQVRLLEYSAVILNNVPANLFSDEERRALAVYVRDLGGGLVMLGGDESFGAGGWMDTPVEEVMPVSFDIKSKKQIPKGALTLVMHACEIPEGNFIGERIAIAAVKTLSSRDLVGVLTFRWTGGNQEYWDVPLQEVGDKTRIIGMIKQMQMGDMPDLDPQMRAAVKALSNRPDAGAKHMIVISDFDPAPPRQDVIDDMKRYGITCSTVGIGFGGHYVDMGKARWIAETTGGRAYACDDFSKLPQIFIKESRIVQRSLLNENPFTPRIADSLSTLIEGLAGEGMPQLGGYVLSTPRPLAQVPLVRKTEDGLDPILAHWQVGLGKSVAFTSGMWTRWGAEWAGWPKFSKVWAQIIRWVSRQSAAAAFDVATSVNGGKGRIRIDALDKNASTINFMRIAGTLVDPNQQAAPLKLTQTGPGRYEAEFDARDQGSYVVNLKYEMGSGANAVSGTLQSGVSVAFSPEYRELRANEPFLSQLAEKTGGRKLTLDQAVQAFDESTLKPAEVKRPIWEDLIRYMLLLFLIDVAVRRIAINPIELARKLRRYIGEIGGVRTTGEKSEAVLASLKGTREKTRETATKSGESEPAPERSRRWDGAAADSRATEQLSQALGGASETDALVVARPTKKKPATTEADFTSRLLKAKQKARDEIKNEGEEQK